ncbi:2,5-diamino-6-(ribosylamino)-4(3H)-pyrimidinone 5'-phosphate reductase [Methanococcoides methylutens]|uniref:2,5-diamino-6-(ribosylamino)-4(3H)-pyrimidinone 5'-phosphate reductase n=1 Tax=Methanococcoides methylutens MM1 TaxID=1434104 RepID=A0A0E3WYX4_METMT|nr:2,5-diamino-6-(ribosylamino)-4(3H)-pyrimidinone 5'-phosphate reductase [Methanococcoides methylutens]AKB84550.1 5-amino-6-(5-phosphoribosylamino)uracil reductase [Methanococcoides methylutens MM1]
MGRPFTFINSAMSADGKISTKERKQVRISGDVDFDRMDELRATSDAIMVGIGTVLADDPSLTVKSKSRRSARKDNGSDEGPIRIVIDSKARTPLDADIFIKGEGKRIIAVSGSAPEDRVKMLQQKALVITVGDEQVDLVALLKELYSMGVKRLMVEGGATLNWAMLSNGLVDEIYSFVGNLLIGGTCAPTLVDGSGFHEDDILKLDLMSMEKMDEGVLLKWAVLNRY